MDTAENLNNLASFDYKIMQMPDVVREWMWNTCFVSRALVDLSEFDRESTKTTKPFVVDPFSLIRDPKGTSVN